MPDSSDAASDGFLTVFWDICRGAGAERPPFSPDLAVSLDYIVGIYIERGDLEGLGEFFNRLLALAEVGALKERPERTSA